MSRNRVWIGVLLFLLAGIGTIVPAGGQEISGKKDAGDEKPAVKVDPAVIAQLIAQLASDTFQTREKAHRQLAKLDEVPDALRQAADGADLEVARRARAVITPGIPRWGSGAIR